MLFLQRKDVQAIVAAVAAGDTAPERANALMRLYAGHALDRLDDDVKAKVWRLADSIRDAQSGDRCLVSVGLEEDEFAGRFGDVVDVSDDGDERAICKVRIDGEEHDFPRWRLKTARGLAHERRGVSRCWIRPNDARVATLAGAARTASASSVKGRCSLVATRSIKAGGELCWIMARAKRACYRLLQTRPPLPRVRPACLCDDCRSGGARGLRRGGTLVSMGTSCVGR